MLKLPGDEFVTIERSSISRLGRPLKNSIAAAC